MFQKILLMTSAMVMATSMSYADIAAKAPTTEEKAAPSKEDKSKKDAEATKRNHKHTSEPSTKGYYVFEPVVVPAPVVNDKSVPPTLKINGFTLFNTYIASQSNNDNGKGGTPLHFSTDASDLYFTIAGQARGIEYMYRVNLQAFANSTPAIDQNYVQIKTDYYGFRLGNTVGPENFAIYDASRVIGGAGGFDSASYDNVYNLSAGVIKGNANIGDSGKATKIVFMGPEYMGFQFFAAFTPHTARRGDDSKNNTYRDNPNASGNSKGMYPEKKIYPFAQNNWSLALNYKTGSGPWSLILSGAAVHESPYLAVEENKAHTQRQKLRASWVYQLGALLGYDAWKFGVGYLNNGKNRLPKVANVPLQTTSGTVAVNSGDMHLGNAGQAWNAGLGYTVGAYEFGASYQYFWRKTNTIGRAENNVFTGTIDFNVFQGWKFYLEVDYIRSKTNQKWVNFASNVNQQIGTFRNTGIGNNRGTVAILGTKISF